MKKLILLLFTMTGFSQTTFVKDSYIFVSNTYLFSAADINLSTVNSFIYLRQDGQLIQSNNLKNTGVGYLSSYQENTVNNFAYNYWCSNVGSNTLSVVNNPFGISQLGNPTSITNSTPAIMLPYNVLDGISTPLGIAVRWIYQLITSSTYSSWIYVGDSPTIGAGFGFTMKGVDITGQQYDFRGKPNTGEIPISVLANELTLVGNPYSSALDLCKFLNREINCTGVAYFWEQDKTVNSHYIANYVGGYSTLNGLGVYVPAVFLTYNGSGTSTGVFSSPMNVIERKYSPLNQGFLIKGLSSGVVTFKNIDRVYNKEGAIYNSEFEKTQEPKVIRLNILMDDSILKQLAIVDEETATEGYDRAMDAESPDKTPKDCFFPIEDKKYVINALPITEDTEILLKLEGATSFKIKVVESSRENVYLRDSITNKTYDIANEITEVPAGYYYVVFKKMFPREFEVYNDNGVLVVQGAEIESYLIYDLLGRRVENNNLATGVYVVSILFRDGRIKTKKIIIYPS